MGGVPVWQVDAFTDRLFLGNPAAVCLLDEERDESWMQAGPVLETNLSETAFVRKVDNDSRWLVYAGGGSGLVWACDVGFGSCAVAGRHRSSGGDDSLSNAKRSTHGCTQRGARLARFSGDACPGMSAAGWIAGSSWCRTDVCRQDFVRHVRCCGVRCGRPINCTGFSSARENCGAGRDRYGSVGRSAF